MGITTNNLKTPRTEITSTTTTNNREGRRRRGEREKNINNGER